MRQIAPGKFQNLLSESSYPQFKALLTSSQCMRCDLSASRTNIVVDRGNPKARVLFIGEAPGENEDLQGQAFVGRSGKLLDALLLQQGFDTMRDGLIVNVVKCRPPKNRAPRPEEVSACSDFLKKQLALVRPEIMVFLGAVSLKHMIPDKKKSGMGQEVGRFFEHTDFPGIRLIALYHPAYILRDPRKRPLMQEHLALLCGAWKTLA